jgi:hypothetical protein
MASNLDTLAWKAPFEPPPQKGPPPKIPLPKPPTQTIMRSNSQPLSPTSNPSGDEYFANVNYFTSTPPRLPPKNNIRAPALHRLSETDSISEADILGSVPDPPFRGAINESPVSPHTVLDKDSTLSDPSAFDLDRSSGSGRKGSASSAGTLGTPQPIRASRGRSLQFSRDEEDEEPAPFVMKSDKHKRILGIDAKTPQIKRPSKTESPKLSSTTMRRKRSIPESNGRSGSPLPAPDVVPFLYQDIEVS